MRSDSRKSEKGVGPVVGARDKRRVIERKRRFHVEVLVYQQNQCIGNVEIEREKKRHGGSRETHLKKRGGGSISDQRTIRGENILLKIRTVRLP